MNKKINRLILINHERNMNKKIDRIQEKAQLQNRIQIIHQDPASNLDVLLHKGNSVPIPVQSLQLQII